MDIQYKGSSKINIFDRKIEFFIFSPIKLNIYPNNKLKFQIHVTQK